MSAPLPESGVARRPILPGAVRGGFMAAAALFAVDVGFGWIAYAPLGMAYADEGIVAAFLAAILGSAIPALVGGAGPLPGGARPAQTLIFAALMASFLPAAGAEADVTRMLVAGALCVMLAGLIQMGFGWFGLGRAIKFAPMPVLSGFTSGVAVSMGINALLSLFPQGLWSAAGLWGPEGIQKVAFAIGLLFLMRLVFRARPALHWSLVGLLAGLALYHGLAALGGDVALGATLPRVEALHPAFPLALGLQQFSDIAFWGRDLVAILAPALTIAMLNSLETLVVASQQDLQEGTRHDANRVLLGQGLANLLGGMLGALPSAPSQARQKICRLSGGVTPAAGVYFALTMLLLLLVVPFVVHWLPRVVIAAILFYQACSLFDDWTLHQLKLWRSGATAGEARRQLHGNLLVIALVMAVANLVNLLAILST